MASDPERRLVRVRFIVDANCVNARQKDHDLNRLEDWANADLIELMTTEIAQREMVAGNNALRSAKAYTMIYTMTGNLTPPETQRIRSIGEVLFPNGPTNSNQQNDVEIVFNSGKYLAPLITNDGGSNSQPGGMLGNREKLRKLGVKVLTPTEAVTYVEQQIAERDKYAKDWAEFYGRELPDWVGQD